VIFTICKTMIIQLIGFNAARKIHRKLLWRLMKAPVRYFDVTPVRPPPKPATLFFAVSVRLIARPSFWSEAFVLVSRQILTEWCSGAGWTDR
jgi:ABC-type multidrug transport system fused ATPase/permease subunit